MISILNVTAGTRDGVNDTFYFIFFKKRSLLRTSQFVVMYLCIMFTVKSTTVWSVRVCTCTCMISCSYAIGNVVLTTRLCSEPNFMWSLLRIGEWKFLQTVQVTGPRWPTCPYLEKKNENILLRNQTAYDLETWNVVSGARISPNLFKWRPWVNLDLFYGKVKFGLLCFCMGKKLKQ